MIGVGFVYMVLVFYCRLSGASMSDVLGVIEFDVTEYAIIKFQFNRL
jgi:hypothetical protein